MLFEEQILLSFSFPSKLRMVEQIQGFQKNFMGDVSLYLLNNSATTAQKWEKIQNLILNLAIANCCNWMDSRPPLIAVSISASLYLQVTQLLFKKYCRGGSYSLSKRRPIFGSSRCEFQTSRWGQIRQYRSCLATFCYFKNSTGSSLERRLAWGSNLRPDKSNALLPTGRRPWNIYSTRAVLPAGALIRKWAPPIYYTLRRIKTNRAGHPLLEKCWLKTWKFWQKSLKNFGKKAAALPLIATQIKK